ncbi:MAG: cytochrome c [Chloroflexota bacterium]|nr:cytochrome c [Chloroflexota bacterium]
MQFKIFIGLVLTLIIVVFIPVYWATEPGRQENALARQTAESVDRGAEKYASNCAACHGSQGERGLGRALAGTMLDSKALQRVIARGVPGTAMPPWGVEDGGPLKDYQIRDLVAFIESLGAPAAAAPKPVAPPSTPTPAPPSPSLSPAAPSVDARALYTGKCSVCHGADLQGSRFGPPLTTESLRAKSDADIRKVIQDGIPSKGMPPFGNTLSAEEMDALLRFIKDAGT